MDNEINKNNLCASQGSSETWCNNVNYIIPSITHSAVEQQDTNRRDTVEKLIQPFESHPNKESFLQDSSKTEENYEFSEKSQKLISDMNNTEIFELCETSSKMQCPDCAFFWEIFTVCCTCGRCLKTFTKNYGVRAEQLRRLINSRLCYQKEHHSRCQTWTFTTATNVLQG